MLSTTIHVELEQLHVQRHPQLSHTHSRLDLEHYCTQRGLIGVSTTDMLVQCMDWELVRN